MNKEIYIYFENGESLTGKSFGYEIPEPILTELVFNTSMTGYQEVLTDPSYCDQSVIMTYPLIGTYGSNTLDSEGNKPWAKGLIVREYQQEPSNYRSELNLQQFLIEKELFGIEDIDTRMLTKKIRTQGTQRVLISLSQLVNGTLSELFKKPDPQDQIARVSTKTKLVFNPEGHPHIALLDFGFKKSILDSLVKRGCKVSIIPYDSKAAEVESLKPHGVLLSNGPGDPQSIPEILPIIRQLQDIYPMLAICMGHQLFALANGCQTVKMKFGHRGANHPVIDLKTKKVLMTSQNHSYCVQEKSVEGTKLEITEINLNDKTIEGLKHNSRPVFSVQYHPEANPGPKDADHLFDLFLKNIRENNNA